VFLQTKKGTDGRQRNRLESPGGLEEQKSSSVRRFEVLNAIYENGLSRFFVRVPTRGAVSHQRWMRGTRGLARKKEKEKGKLGA